MGKLGSLEDDYARVDLDSPCPICGRGSWCLVHRSGRFALCQRKTSDRRFGDGTLGYYHRLTGVAPLPPAEARDETSEEQIILRHLRARRAMTVGGRRNLAHALGVSVESLQALAAGWDQQARAYTFPMRCGNGYLVGLQFRTKNGDKYSLRGSRLGLFLPAEWRDYFGGTVFVCEGASDCAAMLTLGVQAVARPSCTGGAKYLLDLLQRLQPAKIVVVADGDEVGQRGARDFAEHYWVKRRAVVIAPFSAKDARQVIIDKCDRDDLMSAVSGRHSKHWKLLR